MIYILATFSFLSITNVALTTSFSEKNKLHSLPALLLIISLSVVILIPQLSVSFHKLSTSASSTPIGLVKNSISIVIPYLALLASGLTGTSTHDLPLIISLSSTQPFSLLNEKFVNVAVTSLSSWSLPTHTSLFWSALDLLTAVPINKEPVVTGLSISYWEAVTVMFHVILSLTVWVTSYTSTLIVCWPSISEEVL